MTQPENPPAFPVTVHHEVHATGMLLRDWFAGMALQGMLANPHRQILSGRAAAMDAYLSADAMLAERAKESK
jgi:hypothetical protein